MSIPMPDDLFACPYDSTHMVRYQRMPYHLSACRKNHPCTQMATCPLNALHNVLKPELRYHVSVCPDKSRLINDVPVGERESGTYFKGCTKVPEYKQHQIERTEDWDQETQHNKIFVWGESFKYNPEIVGPDDYYTTLSSERDSYLAQLLRDKHLKNKVLEGDDGTLTRLPKQSPKVLSVPMRPTNKLTEKTESLTHSQLSHSLRMITDMSGKQSGNDGQITKPGNKTVDDELQGIQDLKLTENDRKSPEKESERNE